MEFGLMDRVLMLRVQAQGCGAEVLLNDIPVGRTAPQGGTLCLPVHEYLLAGSNEICMVIDPPSATSARLTTSPRVADGVVGASLRLLLPRLGQLGSDMHARTLVELDWAAADGEVYKVPHLVSVVASLPIKFPRWRWLEAPAIDSSQAIKPVAAAYLQDIAVGLACGDVDIFIAASRLRLEEIALAYQQPVADVTGRLRSRLQLLHATKAMKMLIPEESDLVLRPCANGRLLECLSPGGQPVLRTAGSADGSSTAWPVRIAVVNGQCHILR
jgi:hypothetical protein